MTPRHHNLVQRYHELRTLYQSARRRGTLRGKRAQAVANSLHEIEALIAPDHHRTLGDGATSKAGRVRAEFRELISLYVQAIAIGVISEKYRSVLDSKLAGIALLIGLNFAALMAAATSEPATGLPSEGVPVAAAPAAAAPAARASVPGSLTLDEYARAVRGHYLNEHTKELEREIAAKRAEINRLEKKPESFEGTRKAWDESVAGTIGRLRSEEGRLKRASTRWRHDELFEEEHAALLASITEAYERAGGVLTDEERAYRLQELTPQIFHEESTSESFYPTPRAVIDRYLLPNAELAPGLSVLEPSAGTGNIAEAIREACPACALDVIELSDIRSEVLRLKGFSLVGRDALGYKGKRYDRIVMNPPYDFGMGILHIQHAYDNLLKPGGRLVALVNSGSVTNSTDLSVVRFNHSYIEPHGSYEIIGPKEYNEENERKITVAIAVVVLNKPLHEEVTTEENLPVTVGMRLRNRRTHAVWVVDAIDAEGRVTFRNERTGATEITMGAPAYRWQPAESEERITLPERPAEALDTAFVEPGIIVARPELTGSADGFHVDRNLLSRVVKDYAVEGANYAIEALEDEGGFLLVDGTGTGKTIQQLLVAHHYYKLTGKSVLIFTESDQIIQQSFFGDALKLGLSAPDKKNLATLRMIRPKGYKGLYDGPAHLGDEVWHTLDVPVGDKSVNVVRFVPERGLVPGINVGTYNDLSNLPQLKHHPVYEALQRARERRREAAKEYRDRRKTIRKQYRGGQRQYHIRELNKEYEKDPRILGLIPAEDRWNAAQVEVLSQWTSQLSLLIYDEAHNLKNTDRGGSIRAERAGILSERAPLVMFVTATPADKPGDIRYLKAAGVYQNDKQFHRLMKSIGYTLRPAKRTLEGHIIQRAAYVPLSKFPELRAQHALTLLFDDLTERGLMLKRELRLVNLELVRMVDVQVDSDVEMLMREIEDALIAEALDEESEEEKGISPATILMEMKRALEPYKIDECVELTRRELLEGRSVVIFADLVDEGEQEKAWGERKAGVVRVLKERLSAIAGPDQVGLVIGVNSDYERGQRLKHIEAFQRGEKRVIIATIGSGGTGISLDDTVGNAPRTAIIMTAPMNSMKAMQAFGRFIRANSKSRVRIYLLFCKVAVDIWQKNILATKFDMLGAIVAGQVSLLNPRIIEMMESGGDAAAAALFFDSQAQAEDRKPKHSLFDTKAGKWIDGGELPQERPITVGRFKDPDRPGSELVRIRGHNPADLERLTKEYAADLGRMGFTKSSDRYNGTYVQTAYSEEAWTWALNLIKVEQAHIVKNPDRLFHEGETVVLLEDHTPTHQRAGTRGVIVKASPRQGTWVYDVDFARGTATQGSEPAIGKSMYQEILAPIPKTYPYRTGQVWEHLSRRGGTTYAGYTSGGVQERSRLTIVAVHKATRIEYEPRYDAVTTLERQDYYGRWVPDDSDSTKEFRKVGPDVIAAIIADDNLQCVEECDDLPGPDERSPGTGPPDAEPPDAGPPYPVAPGARGPDTDESSEAYEPPYNEDEDTDEDEDPEDGEPLGDFFDDTRLYPVGLDTVGPDTRGGHGTITFGEASNRTPQQAGTSLPVRNVRDIARLNVTRRPLPERFRAIFGMVPVRSTYMLHGPAGEGKSTLALLFADVIARQEAPRGKRVLYVNAEQRSDAGGMTDRIKRAGIRSLNIDIVDTRSLEDVHRLLAPGTYSFVVIDSITRMQGSHNTHVEALQGLYAAYPDVSVMLITHEEKSARTYKGNSGLAHDAEIVVRVEQGVAYTEKNHYGRPGAIRFMQWGQPDAAHTGAATHTRR